MTEYDLLENIMNELEERIDYVRDMMAEGSPKDYAEYKYLVGKCEALYHMQRYVKEIEQKFLEQ